MCCDINEGLEDVRPHDGLYVDALDSRNHLTGSQTEWQPGVICELFRLLVFIQVRHEIKEALEAYPEDGCQRNEWFFTRCAQAILAADQIMWTDNGVKVLDMDCC